MRHKLNVKHLLCPLPVIRLGELIDKIGSGDIQITATDPGVIYDIPAWCKVHGHKLINIKQTQSEIVLVVSVVKEN